VELLALAALMRKRAPPPDKPAEFLAEILRSLAPEKDKVVRLDVKRTWKSQLDADPTLRMGDGRVVALAKPWQELAEDLYERHEDVRTFLLQELDVPQGRDARGINFINPLPVLNCVESVRQALAVSPLDPQYQKNFWETRFTALASAPEYAGLPAALETERGRVRERFQTACRILSGAGYEDAALRAALEAFLADLSALQETQRKNRDKLPDEAFDALVKSQALRNRAAGWGAALEAARALAEANDPAAVVCFDPRPLLELEDVLSVIQAYLRKLTKELDEQDKSLSVDGDPVQIQQDLLTTLATVAEEEAEGDDDAEDADGTTGETAGAAAAQEPGRPDEGLP
jgi:hypothetical protein